MKQILRHKGLAALVVIFLIITGFYNVLLPLTRGNDEFAHFRYVRFIAENHRLPLSDSERDLVGYRARDGFPPFYHTVTALAFFWVNSTPTVFKQIDYGEIPQQALIYELTDVNWILPTEIMNFPYSEAVLLWHLSRGLSSVLAAGAIIFTYLTALTLFPGQKSVALLAASILAFMPRFVFMAATVSDDNMLAFLMALYLFLIVRIIKDYQQRWYFVGAGITLGLAITTKFSVGLVPLATLIFFILLARRQGWRRGKFIANAAFYSLGIILASAWWFVFVLWNFSSGATPDEFIDIVVPHITSGNNFTDLLTSVQDVPTASFDTTSETGASIIDWLSFFWQSFWGVDYLSPSKDFIFLYYLYGVITLIVLIAIVTLIKIWSRSKDTQKLWITCFLLHIMAFLPFMLLRHYLTPRVDLTAQGRHLLMPSVLAIALLLTFGWISALRPKPYKRLVPVLPLVLFFWTVIQLSMTTRIYDNYLPISVNASTQPDLEQPIQQTLFETVELIGYNFTYDQSELELELVWQTHQRPVDDYLTLIQLQDQSSKVVSSWIGHPAGEIYPSRVWDTDEQIINRVNLPLTYLDAGTYKLTVSLAKAYTQPPAVVADSFFSEELIISDPVSRANQGKIIQFDNQPTQLAYQLWSRPKLSLTPPTFKHRATISLQTHVTALPPGAQINFTLVGPDNQPIQPLLSSQTLQNFVVEANWPNGTYQLKAVVTLPDGTFIEELSTSLLTVENQPRLFSPPEMEFQVDANFYDYIKLRGYNLPQTQINPGQALPVFIYWQSLQTINANLTGFTHLYNSDNQLVATFDRQLPPFFGGTIMWVPGEVIGDGFTLPIPPDLPDGIYSLRTGLFFGFDANSWVPVPLMNQQGQPSDITHVTLGQIKVGQSPAEWVSSSTSPQISTEATFADTIRLIGFDLDGTSYIDPSGEQPRLMVTPDTTIKLTTYWQPLVEPPANYTLFVHVHNEQGQTVTQYDRPPTDGAYPTSLWAPGEIIKDQVQISLPDIPVGTYKLVIGLYDKSGVRLSVDNMNTDSVIVESFEVSLP